MRGCMIDLETLNTTMTAPVVSIGAVTFDTDAAWTETTFYTVLDLDAQFACGRLPSHDTLRWWCNQSPAVRAALTEQEARVPQALQSFSQWYTFSGAPPVWGYGANFDISILESLYNSFGLPAPWHYRDVRCLRTFRELTQTKLRIRNDKVQHNALDDARAQAWFLIEVVREQAEQNQGR
jgi:hypothetical protein